MLNFENPDDVFKHLTGRTLRVVLENAWEGVYPFDDIRVFLETEFWSKVDPVLKDLGVNMRPAELTLDGNYERAENLALHKEFPKLDPGITADQLRVTVRNHMDACKKPLYARIEELILEGVRKALVDYPQDRVASLTIENVKYPRAAFSLITKMHISDLQDKQARLLWNETTDLRIPHSSAEVFDVLTPQSPLVARIAKARLDRINAALGMDIPVSSRLMENLVEEEKRTVENSPLVFYLPKADPSLSWDDAKFILRRFCCSCKVDVVEEFENKVRAGARDALLSDPSLKF